MKLPRLLLCAGVVLIGVSTPATLAHAQADAGAARPASCAGGAHATSSGLVVQARVAMLGGAQPAPGVADPAAEYQALIGMPIQVRTADASDVVLAEALTDAQGQVSFADLAPGVYWVAIPQSGPAPALSDAVVSALPDGSRVFASAQATVPDTGAANLTLTAIVPLP